MTIWIDDSTKLRVNIYAPYKGFSKLETAEQRAAANVVEIDEPVRGDEQFYYNTEQDAAPYLVVTPKSVEQVMLVLWERIKQIRDGKTQTSGFPAAGKWFHSDVFSRTQQMALVMMGAGIPANIQWKTMDGSFVLMTQTVAMQVFSAGAAQDQATFATAELHRANLAAMTDVEAMAAYDIHAGWPAGYVAA